MSTTQAGKDAEKRVADRLSLDGYKILELNWKRPHAEIDIVARRDKTMYFVEVKYRGSLAAGDGFDYITSQKLLHMQRAANSWTVENAWEGPVELLAAAVTDTDIDIREVA